MLDLASFYDHVDVSGGPDACHPWTGGRTGNGYGQWHGQYVHRWIMAVTIDRPLSHDEHVLHSCDNPPCVNLQHLRIGTHADNMRDKAERGRAVGWHSAKTHCPQGHPYDEENTSWKKSGARRCKACARAAAEKAARARGVMPKSPPFCPRGHEFTPENTRKKKDGSRVCKECTREYARRHRAQTAEES